MRPADRRFIAGAYLFHRVNKRNRQAQQEASDNLIRAINPEAWRQIQFERDSAREQGAPLRAIGSLILIALTVMAVLLVLGFISSLRAPAPDIAPVPTAVAPASVPAVSAPAASVPAAPTILPMNVVLPVVADAPLREAPDDASRVVEQIHAGQRVRVIGKFCDGSGDCYFEVRKLNHVVGFAAAEVIAE